MTMLALALPSIAVVSFDLRCAKCHGRMVLDSITLGPRRF
jgi:hypothetical protein